MKSFPRLSEEERTEQIEQLRKMKDRISYQLI
jgi:hypothetical protein